MTAKEHKQYRQEIDELKKELQALKDLVRINYRMLIRVVSNA